MEARARLLCLRMLPGMPRQDNIRGGAGRSRPGGLSIEGSEAMKFVWKCGHSFEWSDQEALAYAEDYTSAGGRGLVQEDGVLTDVETLCLDCQFPTHEPVPTVCERCSQPFPLTVGAEAVCDDCLPHALAESLGRIAAYVRAYETRN